VEHKEYGIYFILEEVRINEQGECSITTTSESPYVNREWWKAEIPISSAQRISQEEYDRFKAKMWNEFSAKNTLRKFLTKR
jgi:hypothetical protein